MKAIHPLDDSLKAVGYTSKGERKEFKVNRYGILFCQYEDLVSIEISEGVEEVWCNNNLLTELNIPEGVNYVWCDNNLLTELVIPSSAENVYCINNKITELNIPKRVKELYCDKIVKGLEHIDWDCEIRLY